MIDRYNIDVQRLYLQMFLHDPDAFTRALAIYDVECFDKPIRPVAEFIKTHTEEYKVLPTLEQVKATTGYAFEKVEGFNEGHREWLLDEFETFTRHKNIERAILSSYDLMSKENTEYGEIENRIKAAVQICLTKDIGTDYFENPRARLTSLKDGNGQVSTGWTDIDHALYGGLNRGELTIWAGGSGCVTADTLVEVVELVNIFDPSA